MIGFECLREFAVGRITFPLSQYLFNRKNIMGHFYMLMQSERFPEEDLLNMQLVKLKKLIAYASVYVPYYQKLFKEIGLYPQDINSLSDIKGIPPLGRDDVIMHHRDMVDMRLQASVTAAEETQRELGSPLPFARFRKHKLVKNTSSGSTGTPTVFYEDGSRSALNWAYELRLKSWYGIKPGAREARMVRISTGYALRSRSNLIRRKLWGQLILPGVNLSINEYKLCVKSIVEYRPKVLLGLTSALAGLAEYILENKGCLGLYRPEMVTGWAAPVYEHEEMVLKKAFGCPVTNLYSAREVGHIAGKCLHGYFHINQESLLVESEKTDPYETVDKGTGEILVTNLDISPMPFIRYRMGDVGRLSRYRCSCGRTLQVIEDLLGRTGEIFITKDGRMISPNFWCRTFRSENILGAVNRFQIIYTRNKDIKILLVRGKRYSADTENYIRETVEKNLSANTRLFLEYVPNIEPQVSGKYQMVIYEGNTH